MSWDFGSDRSPRKDLRKKQSLHSWVMSEAGPASLASSWLHAQKGPTLRGPHSRFNALLSTSWNALTALNREPYTSQIMYSVMLRGQGYDQLRTPGSLNGLCYTLQNLTQVRYRTVEEIRGNRKGIGLKIRKNLEPHPDSTIHSWTNH